MNLGFRLTRLEATQPQAMAITIIATDEADFTHQFERALLSMQTLGAVDVSGSIAGVPFAETIDVQLHEDALEAIQ